MNDCDLISIIVPVYNVEIYLKKCIDSIINQTYKNLEIIIIDDGSNDNSGRICDEYLELDGRIRVFHKSNGGLSSARNYGIDKAKGEYICFIDSDDYIQCDMIEKLYNACNNNNAQIACCGMIIEKDNNESKKINCKNEFCINSKEALKRMLLLDEIEVSACDKLYKTELFNDVRYPIGKYYEDMATTYKLLIQAKNVVHINYAGYHYIIRQGSITNDGFDVKHLDMINIAKEIREFAIGNYEDLKEAGDYYYYLQLTTILRKIYNSPNKSEYKKEYQNLKKEYNSQILKILKNKYVKIDRKIMDILIYFNMYKLINIVKK